MHCPFLGVERAPSFHSCKDILRAQSPVGGCTNYKPLLGTCPISPNLGTAVGLAPSTNGPDFTLSVAFLLGDLPALVGLCFLCRRLGQQKTGCHHDWSLAVVAAAGQDQVLEQKEVLPKPPCTLHNPSAFGFLPTTCCLCIIWILRLPGSCNINKQANQVQHTKPAVAATQNAATSPKALAQHWIPGTSPDHPGQILPWLTQFLDLEDPSDENVNSCRSIEKTLPPHGGRCPRTAPHRMIRKLLKLCEKKTGSSLHRKYIKYNKTMFLVPVDDRFNLEFWILSQKGSKTWKNQNVNKGYLLWFGGSWSNQFAGDPMMETKSFNCGSHNNSGNNPK